MIASSSPYTRFVSKFLFPFHELLKGHKTVAVRKQLEESQWHTPAMIRRRQEEKLRSLFLHAVEYVPYYQDRLAAAGFASESNTALDILPRLPLLSKAEIRSNLTQLVSTAPRRLSRMSTGGSTGEPLTFFIDRERRVFDIAAKWRATRWWDVDIGDPEIVLWGAPAELDAQDIVRSVRDVLLRTKLIPAFQMSPRQMNGYIQTIRRFRPKMLFGYPSALALLAKHAINTEQRLDNLGTRVAFTTAECLLPDQRRVISEVFDCRVADGYGGRDSGFIAHQCPAGGMHLSSEYIIVEIIDEQGRSIHSEDAGELVVTNLANFGFPMIRYRTGDIASLSHTPCPCGRGLPTLKTIQGRTTDLLVGADGRIVHALALIYVLRELPGISSFQIVQNSVTDLDVYIVPTAEYSDDARNEVISGCRMRLGQDVAVSVHVVDLIPPERSGKHRHVVSHVDPSPSAVSQDEPA